MSVASQFSGGGIKSIQRGTVSLVSDAATVTITAVNTSKSMLIANSNSGVSYDAGNNVSYALIARARLNSSTQVVVTIETPIYVNAVYPIVDWQVIEYF
jgi:hypothetical protein